MSFKPYYKWITFNTMGECLVNDRARKRSFKPYYKWITFNTQYRKKGVAKALVLVLNLIINGLPSILSFSLVFR